MLSKIKKNIFKVAFGVSLSQTGATNTTPIDFNQELTKIDGQKISLESYKGKTLLIVNTASKCGFTNQYKGLEELYQKYKDKNFEVLGFPSNDFGKQEPGSGEEIKKFCERFSVSFTLFEKGPVSGDKIQPLFKDLTLKSSDDPKKNLPIKWNFEKFLISKDGLIIKRYRSPIEPKDIENDIKVVL